MIISTSIHLHAKAEMIAQKEIDKNGTSIFDDSYLKKLNNLNMELSNYLKVLKTHTFTKPLKIDEVEILFNSGNKLKHVTEEKNETLQHITLTRFFAETQFDRSSPGKYYLFADYRNGNTYPTDESKLMFMELLTSPEKCISDYGLGIYSRKMQIRTALHTPRMPKSNTAEQNKYFAEIHRKYFAMRSYSFQENKLKISLRYSDQGCLISTVLKLQD